MTVRAGVAVLDITPGPGTPLSGFAVRTAPASGVHDVLSVRALCVGDTALVTVDVVGLHETLCRRVRDRCADLAPHVVVHATHTHGGPASMPGRLGGDPDPRWLATVEQACVDAVRAAAGRREDVLVLAGVGTDPGVARNRRRPDGPVDRDLPVVRFVRDDGTTLAVLVSHACHPVVLGPHNTLLTADYPAVVRGRLERTLATTVLHATGCAGDVNTGHGAADSFRTATSADRTFAASARAGARVADAALRAVPAHGSSPGSVGGRSVPVLLDLEVDGPAERRRAAARWSAARAGADPAADALYRCWADWARAVPVDAPRTWAGDVTVLSWGPVTLVALPGEPFAATAATVRARLAATAERPVVVIGYSNGVPGYLPTVDEYPLGGYEVLDAHRYYGMPGRFAPGSAERVADAAVRAAAGIGS
ncbi:hypothetical protein [Pseudonocardia sp. ICBG1293]|uniref:hypothetical protein n=1 Tax=Pseudonocardia sp. ICBG1293 TaxID=2844382 RepID=UPI001CCFD970|nr:hypothetical protein [Pseudonocardia sp. ICBG1293]